MENIEIVPPRFMSLFAGIGGFDLAFKNAGFVCDSMVEIDKDAQRILRRQFPEAKLYDDVRKVGIATHAKGSIDVICGGFPCQDVSVAGKRAGFAGERTSLWYEFARIIDELEPPWVVPENVPGLFSSWTPVENPPHEMEVRDFSSKEEAEDWASRFQGDWRVEESSDFEAIISFFQQRGYGLAWRVLDSQFFGVPQRRRRIFLVASLGTGRCAEVLFEREGVPGNIETSREAGEGPAHIPGKSPTLRSEHDGSEDGSEDGNGRRALIPDIALPILTGNERSDPELQNYVPVVFQQNTRDEVRLMQGDGQIAGALGAEPGVKQQNYLAFDWQSGGDVRHNVSDKPNLQANQVPAVAAFDLSMSETNRSDIVEGEPAPSLKNGDRISIFTAGASASAGSVAASETTSPTLKGQHSSAQVPSVALALTASPTASGRMDPSGETFIAEISPTLDAGYYAKRGNDQQFRGQGGDGFPVTAGGVRRLTPLECERLQGFPDGWSEWGVDEHGLVVQQSDSARYKQAGNAVSIPPVEWIAKRIYEICQTK